MASIQVKVTLARCCLYEAQSVPGDGVSPETAPMDEFRSVEQPVDGKGSLVPDCGLGDIPEVAGVRDRLDVAETNPNVRGASVQVLR